MPFDIGFGEILVVLILALLVFGGRLPEVGRSLGRSVVEFKRGLSEAHSELEEPGDQEEGEEEGKTDTGGRSLSPPSP